MVVEPRISILFRYGECQISTLIYSRIAKRNRKYVFCKVIEEQWTTIPKNKIEK